MSTINTIDLGYKLDVEVVGATDVACSSAVKFALELLDHKLSENLLMLVSGTKVEIEDGVIDSGAQTYAEQKKIILDARKNALSLKEAEILLVKDGTLNSGDWSKALKFAKNEPWSCLTYQLVHEFGHLIDGLSGGPKYERLGTSLSPTKYGSTNSSETFAEVFAYWVFDLPFKPQAKKVIEELVAK